MRFESSSIIVNFTSRGVTSSRYFNENSPTAHSGCTPGPQTVGRPFMKAATRMRIPRFKIHGSLIALAAGLAAPGLASAQTAPAQPAPPPQRPAPGPAPAGERPNDVVVTGTR